MSLRTLVGLWIIRESRPVPSESTLLARVQDDLYVLAFSSATRAIALRDAFGATGQPFLVVGPNVAQVVGEARDVGAKGFILDYDAGRATFSAAHELPEGDARAA